MTAKLVRGGGGGGGGERSLLAKFTKQLKRAAEGKRKRRRSREIDRDILIIIQPFFRIRG
jgi:hypothetical protein